MSQFSMRWKNHQPNFISVFTTLLNTQSLVDVTLAAEGKHLQAHKVVLAACSIYFQNLFAINPSHHPIVILKDVSFADLRVLVDFMYYGEVKVTTDQMPSILDVGRLLEIKGLTEMPDLTKQGSPPAEPVSSERRTKDAEVNTELEQATSKPCRSISAKQKRKRYFFKHKNLGKGGVQKQEPTKKGCVLSDIAAQTEPARSTPASALPQHKGTYRLPDIGDGGGGASSSKNITLRENVKLTESNELDVETQEFLHKFRDIVNELTPENLTTLMEKVRQSEINTKAKLECVADLIIEKAIEETNLSAACAAMCGQLSRLTVPADNSDVYVSCFRVVVINKCQVLFEAIYKQESQKSVGQEPTKSTDQSKKEDLQVQGEEENRRVRMRSTGIARFIGELYKQGCLIPRILLFCLTNLVDKLNEEKLECLYVLLATIGEQLQQSMGKWRLDEIFRQIQDILDCESNIISSRVRLMLQDVTELRRLNWKRENVDAQRRTKKRKNRIQK